MNKKSIKEKEFRRSSNNKYFYISLDKPKEFTGETVEEFKARGGIIKQIVKKITPGRDETGKFLKKEITLP